MHPVTLDDAAFINQTQRSKRETKSERRERERDIVTERVVVSDEFCSLFHNFN